jgi:glycosyltransferase involved in cell wall biosynthesis
MPADSDPAGPIAVLAVVVLTFQEERNLPDCLASVSGLGGELLVVDSGSTDRTVALAERFGARVLPHPFESHTQQWRWALSQLPAGVDWVLGLDADQRLSPGLRREIEALFRPEPPAGLDGFYLNRRQVFRGRWIRHGGYYPKYLLKLFRPERVRFDELDLTEHHFYPLGRTARLRGDLIEDNQKERDLAFWLEKHIRYARLQAREELLRRRAGRRWQLRPSLFGNADQQTLWLKERWYRLPRYLRPSIYFFYRYLLRLGFLDGPNGFLFHFLQTFWYRVLVDAYLEEYLAEPPAAADR